ncbi:MAG: hypothetical protein KKA67_12370 [Spirochaetes bacterium]|nr:hypothetical protein [Spirochaetota bacterium]MBU1082198.1 hypothetical protein [Spirochaetota bacterium]
MKKLSIAIAAAAILASSAFGLDIKDGRMRLVLDERSGRFALYYLEDVARNRYAPLLYDQETRTTYATLSFDQKTYKLGDASEFRVSVSRQDGGARVEFRSSFCVVKQTFSFLASPGATMSDGLGVAFEIENVSQKDAEIGLRVLLDTWLGEKGSAHFSTQALGPLSIETALSGDYSDAWIRSSDGQAVTGLQVQLAVPATRPDRLVAANWKRLNDNAWSFEANPARNFTLLPYSINDSAIAMYFEPAPVRPGSTRAIRTVLSQATDSYPTVASAPAAAGPADPAGIPVPADTAPLDEMADLVAARSVLDAVNAALASGAGMSADDIAALESILRRLEARKSKY